MPNSAGASAEILAESVGHYVFISSISAYADFSAVGMDETAPLARLTAEQAKKVEAIDASGDLSGPALGEMYGALKVLCEREAERGGAVLAPGNPNRFVQFIDACDLSEWIITIIENKTTGIFNAMSAPEKLTMSRLLDQCRDATGGRSPHLGERRFFAA